MARKKISELESATDVTANDLIQIVDVEDDGMAITGTNKKATANLLANELGKLTNITATGSTTARSLANRFADVVNVKDFGAIGDGITDDASAIQAALNAADLQGGGVVYFPEGVYKQNSPVSIKNNTHIWAYGSTVNCVDIPYSTTVFNFNAAYQSNGSIKATTTLSSTANKDSKTIQVTSANGISVGDIVRIVSTEVSFVESSITYFKYDVNRVTLINGTTLSLESPIIETLTTSGQTVTVTAYTPLENVSISGLKIIGGGYKEPLANGLGQTAISASAVSGFNVIDCEIESFQGTAINFGVGVDIKVSNCRLLGADYNLTRVEGTSSGFYGFYPSYCRRTTINNTTGIRLRHVADAINCIDVIQSNNFSTDSWRAAFGTHGMCWNVVVESNVVNGGHSGVTCRGITTRIINNTIENVEERGVDTTENNATYAEIEVIGNEIIVNGGLLGQAGIGIDLKSSLSKLLIANNIIQSKDQCVWVRANAVTNAVISQNTKLSSSNNRSIEIGDSSSPSTLNKINGLSITENVVSAVSVSPAILIHGSQVSTSAATNIFACNNIATDLQAYQSVVAAKSASGTFVNPVILANNILTGSSGLNVAIAPSDFSDAGWTKTRLTVSSNTTASPLGQIEADTITDDTSTGTHFIRQSINAVNGYTYKFGIFAKAGTLSKVNLGFDGAFSSSSARFDLSTGVLDSTSGVLQADITKLPNGWYYMYISQTANSTASGLFTIFLVNNSNQVSYTGTGTGNVVIWQAGVTIEPSVVDSTSGVGQNLVFSSRIPTSSDIGLGRSMIVFDPSTGITKLYANPNNSIVGITLT